MKGTLCVKKRSPAVLITQWDNGLPEHLSTLSQQANKFQLANLLSLGAMTLVIS